MTDKTQPELKPCPFCGGEVELYSSVVPKYCDILVEMIPYFCDYAIGCSNCNDWTHWITSSTPPNNYSCEARKQAKNRTVKLWNTRPQQQALEVAKEALQDFVDKVESGRALSKDSYTKFKAAIELINKLEGK